VRRNRQILAALALLAAASVAAPGSAVASLAFQDVAAARGLVFTAGAAAQAFAQVTDPHWARMQRIMGTGAAVGDVDGDGDLDVYLLGHLGEPNRLFRNDHGEGGGFTDVTPPPLADPGLSRVAQLADLDGDGDPDLVLLNDHDDASPPVSRARLFRNDGGGAWTDVTAASGFAPVGYLRTGLAVVDYDGDGRLDLYVSNWSATAGGPPVYPGAIALYRNLGGLQFADVTAAAGLGALAVNGYTPLFADLDDDGDPDLHQAVDFGPDLLFRNDGGAFVDVTASAGVGHTGNDMGVACADVDDDGDLDLYLTNITDPLDAFGLPSQGNVYWESRLAQTGTLTFDDRAAALGIADTAWGWGTAFADLDRDGDLDLVAVTGFEEAVQLMLPLSLPLSQTPAYLFENDGAGGFARVTGSGLDAADDARGLVAFDYDRDGDLDLLVTNHARPVRLYENQGGGAGHWLTVRLGPDALAVGAAVRATVGARTQRRDVVAGGSYLAGTPAEVHFGLGAAAQVDELRVRWRNGAETVLEDVAADQVLSLTAPAAPVDGDGDGLVDADEAALGTDPQDADSDGDGLPDGAEVGAVASPVDTDGDGTIDALDADDDGDGIPTASEDTNGNGNPADDDADGDGIPDCRESDADGDGASDGADNCRLVPNPSQSDVNGDGVGDACQPGDLDRDGWPNAGDNCVVVANPLQQDADANGVGDACTDSHSVARQWNEELLGAIRRDFARPTVHARNLYHVSAALWDAWAAYDDAAAQVFHGERATAPDVHAARAKTLSYAAYRLLKHRFAASPGAAVSNVHFDERMRILGLDASFTATSGDVDPPAELGNRIAATVIAFGLVDGSNEPNGYANQHYQPVNPPLIMALPGNPDVADPNRWQPLTLTFFVDQSGNPIPGGFPPFLSPEWGQVATFSLTPGDVTLHTRGGHDWWVYHDPGPPPLLGTASAEDYLDGFEMVAIWSSHLDPGDGVMWDVSPAAQGNAPLAQPGEWRQFYDVEGGGDWGTGYAVNPVTGQPYAPQIVPRGDYVRVLAEFWADGPQSETPPGHWFTIANYVSDQLPEKRLLGTGPALGDLEWDVKLYLALGGTMHDVAVAVWGMKGWYDYARPVSALRAMAERGQRSDPGLPSYHPEGFELRPGFIELITPESSAPGERHAHLSAYVGEVAIRAWRGPAFVQDPATDVAGVGWIRAKEWWPYQRPTFVTPPFAGYPSGHSAYSRAAATVLHQLTGSPWFPGGLGEFHAEQNEHLVFEEGPSVDVVLQHASYYDASDQTSLSRIWGGIHPPQDDLVSRHVGAAVAADGIAHALALFAPPPADGDADGVPDAADNCPLRANADQADTDQDGVGDLCDALCVGATTSIASVDATTVPQGASFRLTGSGLGPAGRVRIGPAEVAPYSVAGGWIVTVPLAGLAPGAHAVEIVNPEGCRSQEDVVVTVEPPLPSCGLLGMEALVVLGGARRLHGRKRRQGSASV